MKTPTVLFCRFFTSTYKILLVAVGVFLLSYSFVFAELTYTFDVLKEQLENYYIENGSYLQIEKNNISVDDKSPVISKLNVVIPNEYFVYTHEDKLGKYYTIRWQDYDVLNIYNSRSDVTINTFVSVDPEPVATSTKPL